MNERAAMSAPSCHPESVTAHDHRAQGDETDGGTLAQQTPAVPGGASRLHNASRRSARRRFVGVRWKRLQAVVSRSLLQGRFGNLLAWMLIGLGVALALLPGVGAWALFEVKQTESSLVEPVRAAVTRLAIATMLILAGRILRKTRSVVENNRLISRRLSGFGMPILLLQDGPINPRAYRLSIMRSRFRLNRIELLENSFDLLLTLFFGCIFIPSLYLGSVLTGYLYPELCLSDIIGPKYSPDFGSVFMTAFILIIFALVPAIISKLMGTEPKRHTLLFGMMFPLLYIMLLV
jgi:hypothetical protein